MRSMIGGLIFIVITLACNKDKTPFNIENEEPSYFTRTISGYVQMEHQTNHDDCAVFLDSVNIGTYTDSSGFYKLTLADSMFNSDTLLLQGKFRLYFYCYNYELDSLYVAVGSKGFIKDSLGIDTQGHVIDMLIKQVFSIKLVTDTTYYAVGDTIWMTMYMKKYGTDTIEIEIWRSVSGEIGPVFALYALPYNYWIFKRDIDAQVRYVWSDSTIVIELTGFWALFESFFPFCDCPSGYYTVIPHLLKSDTHIGKWWRIPEGLKQFLPRNQFLDGDYLLHPKKFETPTIYLDSIQTKK